MRLINGQLPARQLPPKKWSGTPYGGKRLLLVIEQGFGDTLWVACYLPWVSALGGDLIIECQRELIPLIAAMGLDASFVARGEPTPDAGLYCYLCRLPGLFTRDFASIPTAPYLSAPADRVGSIRP
ncbi:MAG TPA: hypothetical protein VM711_04795, partial [Sphingomicrobium sp.]|nr:hypothetical protein [Sphingomicrobium sp.]